MPDSPSRLGPFLRELKRRKVFRVAAVYAVVAFVLVEAASYVFPALLFPDWALRLLVVLALFGFPIALVLAWAFEVTPEGVRLTPSARRRSRPRAAKRRISASAIRIWRPSSPRAFSSHWSASG